MIGMIFGMTYFCKLRELYAATKLRFEKNPTLDTVIPVEKVASIKQTLCTLALIHYIASLFNIIILHGFADYKVEVWADRLSIGVLSILTFVCTFAIHYCVKDNEAEFKSLCQYACSRCTSCPFACCKEHCQRYWNTDPNENDEFREKFEKSLNKRKLKISNKIGIQYGMSLIQTATNEATAAPGITPQPDLSTMTETHNRKQSNPRY